MSTLLFPGRHLVNTRFQADYLRQLIGRRPGEIPGLVVGRDCPSDPIDRVVFAITSANQDHSRYNPIPFHIRAIGVDRFARELQALTPFTYRIVGIPHYGHTANFAAFTLKEISAQTEHGENPNPAAWIVLCSTPEVIRLYGDEGFSVATAELSAREAKPALPLDLIRQVAEVGPAWAEDALIERELSRASRSLFQEFPEIPRRIHRIYRDPLTNQEGSLTDTRNYSTYARGMSDIIHLKYQDIRAALRAGRIVDEGCADGALLVEIARDFPDSDLFGIDLSAEFAARFHERKRAGEFGNAYTGFYLRNLLDQIFEPESVDTTICNSTLHELWSYAEQEKTVRAYLTQKFAQLRPAGRLVVRDVVGPEDGARKVLLWCDPSDGVKLDPVEVPAERPVALLQRLSTHSRFRLFAQDFLSGLRRSGRRPDAPVVTFEETPDGFLVPLRTAAEFLSKKDFVDNWLSEMNEEFCFWSFSHWREVLREVGFTVVEGGSANNAASRVYSNPWIVEHRYRNRVRLLDPETSAELDYPPTNMVLVAEKSAGGA